MSPDTQSFYQDLPGFSNFSELSDPRRYRPLPNDWLVAISDVRGSTRAIQAGRYKEVNAVGVASIAALLNALKPLPIPYVFGGDGATACLPERFRDVAADALIAARRMAKASFGLDLRVGLAPVAQIRQAGREVLVSKFAPDPWYRQAMFLGDGLGCAETWIKDPAPNNPFQLREREDVAEGRFEGFECRWNEIPSPHEEIISLLVQAVGSEAAERDAVYAEVIGLIGDIYGDESDYHPLRPNRLTLATSWKRLSVETRIRRAFGSPLTRLLYLLRLRILVMIGRRLMAKGTRTDSTDWGQYKANLIANSDYRKFDELLRMVISGTVRQRRRLRQALEERRRAGRLVYGIHAAATALMTCVVSDYAKDHVHFLDGANGGYAMAAMEMKGQLAGLASPPADDSPPRSQISETGFLGD